MPLNGGVPTTAVGDGSMKIPKPLVAAKSLIGFARVPARTRRDGGRNASANHDLRDGLRHGLRDGLKDGLKVG
ncbi:MAG: hypothetical protein RL591_2357 [Planctomycetota bacterium]|jgi:hypothetical protein